jgi:hypothetical protein
MFQSSSSPLSATYFKPEVSTILGNSSLLKVALFFVNISLHFSKQFSLLLHAICHVVLQTEC